MEGGNNFTDILYAFLYELHASASGQNLMLPYRMYILTPNRPPPSNWDN